MFDSLRKNCKISAFSVAIFSISSIIGYFIEEHQLKLIEKEARESKIRFSSPMTESWQKMPEKPELRFITL